VSLLEAIVLGVVQGLTEFLPISSTAHLRIVPALFGWQDPGAAFSAVIQIGTLAAVAIYFWNDIIRITAAVLRGMFARHPLYSFDSRLGWMIVVGTVPIVVCGLALKDAIETGLRGLYVVAGALIGLAVILAGAEWVLKWRLRHRIQQRHFDQLAWPDAIAIGLAQALALVPGASRSGVTITAGLLCNLDRATAARFSFLLSLPSIFAAGVYQLWKARSELLGTTADLTNLAAATLVSGVVGYAAIAFLLRFLKTHTTWLFIWYRLALGGLILGLLAGGRLSP
jgi:undecaprenyl-diphosphatase